MNYATKEQALQASIAQGMKTSELAGAALDWAVAKCEGFVLPDMTHSLYDWFKAYGPRYSTNWSQGGPIIELNEIGSFHYIHGFHGPTWSASIGSGGFQQDGPTPLIAAMRCYVASKLGDIVDIPEELLESGAAVTDDQLLAALGPCGK